MEDGSPFTMSCVREARPRHRPRSGESGFTKKWVEGVLSSACLCAARRRSLPRGSDRFRCEARHRSRPRDPHRAAANARSSSPLHPDTPVLAAVRTETDKTNLAEISGLLAARQAAKQMVSSMDDVRSNNLDVSVVQKGFDGKRKCQCQVSTHRRVMSASSGPRVARN